ncbi:MAG: chromosomal replication initiator protein DnaA [Candidatus Pacebacteria bacterium]|nr:chromosomal replication initiator protein DnaA [Candidatus Paceibacterota bacterium]
MELEQLWQAVLGEVELQISRPNFVTWLKNSRLMNRQDGVVFVSLPNSFAKEWVENKYHKIIFSALRNKDSATKKVEYIVENKSSSAAKSAPRGTKNSALDTTSKDQQSFVELKVDPETNLNPKYTLNSFIVGSSNELPYAAATGVIKEVGKKYNPLFIYGGVGLGKTHLIQALGNEIRSFYENKVKVKYVSSEKFTNDVIWAMRNKRMEDVKEKYRLTDVLIIDDIQFIGGKEKTEEEFFHTFNALYENNKQIIISSDRPPRFLPTLEERLRSRFEGGMVAEINPPDYELRMAILKTKLQEKNSSLQDNVIDLIATKVQKNLRELEGILNKILFYKNTKNMEITPKLAEEIINETVQQPIKNINPNHIIKVVAEFFEISPNDLTGRCRKNSVAEPRQIAMYLLRDLLGLSYPFIGEKLGKRDHTTAIYAYNKLSQEIAKDQNLNQKIISLKDMISKE